MLSAALSLTKEAVFFFSLLAVITPVSAQTPFLPDESKFGRPADQDNLSYCIDKRDPAWEVDARIAEAVASALLLNPDVYFVEDSAIRADVDQLYRHLRANCRLYFGFKLLPEVYPDWLTVTRAYYEIGYVFVTANPNWARLGDVPRDQALGPSLATAGDFRLVAYLNAQPANQRWSRYPMPNDAAALKAVIEGRVAAALVWAPSMYELGKSNPEIARLRILASDPMPEERVSVGAVLLSGEGFLSTSVDQAITTLINDGTIGEIVGGAGFPATPPSR